MEFNTDINKFEIFAQTTPNSGFTSGVGFVYSNRSVGANPEKDFLIPVFLKKKYNYYEYTDVKKDDTIIPIQRQEINPYFIEFSFFDDIERVGLQNGYQLTNTMVEFIKTRRMDMSGKTDQEVRQWFENYGYYDLPWNKGTSSETTLAEIENNGILLDTISGKAKIFNITINT